MTVKDVYDLYEGARFRITDEEGNSDEISVMCPCSNLSKKEVRGFTIDDGILEVKVLSLYELDLMVPLSAAEYVKVLESWCEALEKGDATKYLRGAVSSAYMLDVMSLRVYDKCMELINTAES